MKRIFSFLTELLLCAALLISMAGVPALAEETDPAPEETSAGEEDPTNGVSPTVEGDSYQATEGFSYKFDHYCGSLYMVSMDTGQTIYSLNADEKRPIASLTKIMTYIVAYENIPDPENTVVTVSPEVAADLEGTGSSLSGILEGEELTVLQLLHLMMIPSGNDAALALAKYYDSLFPSTAPEPDSEEDADEDSDGKEEGTEGGAGAGPDSGTLSNSTGSAFIDLMNRKARELGCSNTHFVNPHGLYDPNHYSTARDMAIIAEYATTLPYFTEITGSTSYTLPPTNLSPEERTVYTTNMMMTQVNEEYTYIYTTGIKTGSLTESGYCIVASALYEGYSYIVVALGSPYLNENGEETNFHGEMKDAAALFRWAFTRIEMKPLAAKGDLLGDVELMYAWEKDRLQVVADKDVAALLPSDVSVSSIIVSVDLPQKVQAPIKKGDRLGKATFSYANEIIAEVELVASESVERSQIVQTVETGKEVISSPWFLIIAGAIAVVLVFYIIIIILYNRKKKKMRRVKQRRIL